MKIQEIRERWMPDVKNLPVAIELWDKKAIAFANMEIPTSKDSLVMRLISENQMISPNQMALDIGCGSGRFSFALEQLDARVTGTDFSPRMIEECEKIKNSRSSSVNFFVNDWENADLHTLDWNNKFDLVLANMTPAVASADSFLKLSQASRNWCLMVKPTRRQNSVLDKITDMLEISKDTSTLDETLLYAFELLWQMGINPKIEYENRTWEISQPIDDAIEEYTLRISSSRTISEIQKEKIKEFLHSISIGGIVKETTHTTIAALYWQV